MAALVGIDARVDYSTNLVTPSYTAFAERNEFSINIAVDVAEHRPFVANLASAWVGKARTWMSWSGSLSGYYDDADDTIFTLMTAGAKILLRFYETRSDLSTYYEGEVLLTSVDHSVTTDDFAMLSVDFEGSDTLTRA